MPKKYVATQGADVDLGEVTHRVATQDLTASGAITVKSGGVVSLTHATVIIAATLDARPIGTELTIGYAATTGTAAHTVTLPAGETWDGTNNTLTLNAPGESVTAVKISATRWYVKASTGTPAFSSV